MNFCPVRGISLALSVFIDIRLNSTLTKIRWLMMLPEVQPMLLIYHNIFITYDLNDYVTIHQFEQVPVYIMMSLTTAIHFILFHTASSKVTKESVF